MDQKPGKSVGLDEVSPQLPRRRGRPAKGYALRSEQILPAALTCFAQYGFEGTNLRQIAAAAGIDVALIPHRFGSKTELWRAVVDDLAASFLDEMSAAAGPVAGDLQQALEQLVNVVCARREVAMFLVKEVAQQDARFDHFYERLIRPVHDLILPLIPPAGDSEAMADPDFFFFTFTGAVAVAVAMRPFIARFSAAAETDDGFRRELKRLLFQPGSFGFTPPRG